MRHGSLFSGIGGFDLAAEWMGWDNVFHCEWNTFGQRVLKHYWPEAELFTDITKSDFTKYANKIDILTGGFPCQPYSTAGKRKGKDDDRHLWPEMLRAIREVSPRWIVGENVRGLVNWNGGMVFDEVQADLETESYEVLPFLLPACAVNAPHRRDRIWFIAYTGCDGFGKLGLAKTGCQEKTIEGNEYGQEWNEKNGERNGGNAWGAFETRFIANTDGGKRTARMREREQTYCQENRARVDHRFTRFGNNRPGTWKDFPTQPPICTRNDGISARLDLNSISKSKWRNESIKAAGNAIVPQVVFEIFKAIELYELQS